MERLLEMIDSDWIALLYIFQIQEDPYFFNVNRFRLLAAGAIRHGREDRLDILCSRHISSRVGSEESDCDL